MVQTVKGCSAAPTAPLMLPPCPGVRLPHLPSLMVRLRASRSCKSQHAAAAHSSPGGSSRCHLCVTDTDVYKSMCYMAQHTQPHMGMATAGMSGGQVMFQAAAQHHHC